MLRIDGVVAGYGSTMCLRGVSFEVREGEIVALLGANGAGKTTTLLAISGLVRVRQGSIWLGARRLDGGSPEVAVACGIGHVPEGRRVFARLSVLENLQLGAYRRRDRAGIAKDLQLMWELFPVLAQRHRQLAGTLSGGEQQMLAIGRGMMGRPRVLLLDEPSLGLAPKLTQQVLALVQRINRQAGTTVLLVEQNVSMALSIAARGYILEAGTMVMSGTAQMLANDPNVKAAYLGG